MVQQPRKDLGNDRVKVVIEAYVDANYFADSSEDESTPDKYFGKVKGLMQQNPANFSGIMALGWHEVRIDNTTIYLVHRNPAGDEYEVKHYTHLPPQRPVVRMEEA